MNADKSSLERLGMVGVSRRKCLSILLGALSCVFVSETRAADRGLAGFAKALAWVVKHSASPDDGGLLSQVEELIAFYSISNFVGSAGTIGWLDVQLLNRIQAINTKCALDYSTGAHVRNPLDPATYLIAARISERYGVPAWGPRRIIESWLNSEGSLTRMTARYAVWSMCYLARLGYLSPSTVFHWLLARRAFEAKASVTGTSCCSCGMPNGEHYQVRRALYDSTHEILALCDFGWKAESFLLPVDIPTYRKDVTLGLEWARTANELDVMAELLVCARILDLGTSFQARNAVEHLLYSQLEDGSWNFPIEGRMDPQRHVVLTSMAALAAQTPGVATLFRTDRFTRRPFHGPVAAQ